MADDAQIALVAAAIDDVLEITKDIVAAGGQDEETLLEQAREKLTKAGVAAIDAFHSYRAPEPERRVIR